MPPDTKTQIDQLPQIIERLNAASNVLVTVSNNPSVDQLAACIGLTLALNKQGKHATAVFSGKVPSTLEFLQPEKTIETNTNSLRDFIISLDKSKADKLRYKVEDDFVKIFITPYRTSIDEKDLAFTQGDFNIDLIITLGVHERTHLDAAIVAHGRILHDAAVVSMTTDTASEIGTMNWVETESSSLCEMTSDLVIDLNRDLLDSQIATALLTGMVAETDRFGNEKARPHTMSISGVLMAAGASPQLIANKLDEPVEPDDEIPAVVDDSEQESDSSDESSSESEAKIPKEEDGTIRIDHDDDILIDEHGKLQAVKDIEAAEAALEEEAKAAEDRARAEADQRSSEVSSDPKPGEVLEPDSKMIMDPPQMGGQLTANSVPEYEQYSPSTDPLTKVASSTPLLERTERHMVQEPIIPPEMPPEDQTLTEIEKSVSSPHLQHQNSSASSRDSSDSSTTTVPPPPPVDNARAAVDEAVEAMDAYRPEPINALGAAPVDLDLGQNPSSSSPTSPPPTDDDNSDESQTPDSQSQGDNQNPSSPSSGPASTPPPVPPPLMPPGL